MDIQMASTSGSLHRFSQSETPMDSRSATSKAGANRMVPGAEPVPPMANR